MTVEMNRGGEAPARVEATSQELERLRARLHDTALQTLEFIASGGMLGDGADPAELMRLAAREATELRECLEGLVGGEGQSLAEGLERAVAHERCMAGHEIELVLGPADGSVRGLACVDLVAAVREALVNARKHARATRVTVYCEERDGTALARVEDDGVGVELGRLKPGLGLRHSLIGRMRRLGGDADFDSAPGQGTRVTLRLAPAAEAAG